jgi:hypothetical protein
MKKLCLILLGLLFLSGCAQLTPVGKAYKRNAECFVEITKNPHVQRVDRELIPVDNTDPAIKYALLNSTDRIQEGQKQSLGIYMMLVQQCYDEFVIGLYGTPLQKPWQKQIARFNSQTKLLYKGDITIGEYNTAYVADSKQFAMELQGIYQAMRTESAIDQVNAARMFGNSPSTIFVPQVNPANRPIPVLGEAPPAYVPPVQTICQPNGVGGFMCSSR